MLKTKMQEWVEKELFERKGMVVLEVTDEVYKHYKSYIKNNKDESLWNCRKS